MKWYTKHYKLISLLALIFFVASVSYYQQAILSYILCAHVGNISINTDFLSPIIEKHWVEQTSKMLVNILV